MTKTNFPKTSITLDNRIEKLFTQCYQHAQRLHRSDLISDIEKLWQALTLERADSLSSYFKNAGLRRAYLGYYMPLYAAKIALLLGRLTKEGFLSGFVEKPMRVLDLGSGPLVGIAAVRLAFGPLKRAIAADREIGTMRSGYDFLKPFLNEEEAKQIFLRRANLSVQKSFDFQEPFDLVILSHVLNEFGSSSRFFFKKLDIILAAIKMLADGGRMLIMEPGNRICSRDLMVLRDALYEEASVSILAPCTGIGQCPLLKKATDWCHGELDWKRPAVCAKIDEAIGFDKSILKYSYLLLSKRETQPKAVKDWRIVSGNMIHEGVVRRYVCTPSKLLTLVQKEVTYKSVLTPLVRGELRASTDFDGRVQTVNEKSF
jgi:ribosomal protein RSM22 (predicted rRNA methylase)